MGKFACICLSFVAAAALIGVSLLPSSDDPVVVDMGVEIDVNQDETQPSPTSPNNVSPSTTPSSGSTIQPPSPRLSPGCATQLSSSTGLSTNDLFLHEPVFVKDENGFELNRSFYMFIRENGGCLDNVEYIDAKGYNCKGIYNAVQV